MAYSAILNANALMEGNWIFVRLFWVFETAFLRVTDLVVLELTL